MAQNIVFSERSGLNDSVFGKSQDAIKRFIEKRGEGWEQTSALPYLFAMENTKNPMDKYTSMTAMSGFQPVGENGEFPRDSMQESYPKTFEQETWKDSFAISKEMVRDSKLIDFKKKPAQFTDGFYRTREEFGAALYGAAMSGNANLTFKGKTFSTLGADELPLFDKQHPSKVNKKKQSNQFADAFSNDALMAMESAMHDFKGDNDNILDVAPNVILLPNDFMLKKNIFAAIGADKDPATANNGFNYTFGRWTVVVWSYLNRFVTANTHPWVLLDSKYNEDFGGAVWLDRQALEVDSYIDHGNGANVWTGDARWTAGFNDWRFAAVGGVAGGTQLITT